MGPSSQDWQMSRDPGLTFDQAHAVMEASQDAALIVDTEGRILAVNTRWQSVLAPPNGDSVGQVWSGLVSADVETAGETPTEVECLTRNGDRASFSIAAIPCALPDGGAGALWQFHDVTRFKQEVRNAREAEREASEVRSQFLASMSHELRTPLNIVQGYGELLLDQTSDPTETEYLEIILNATRKLGQMLENVLDLSKIDAGQIQVDITGFDLAGLFEEVRQDWRQPIHNKGLEFVSNFDEQIATFARSDRVRLKQVLTNYMSNAVQFTETGRIILTATLIETRPEGQLVRFEVQDSGRGVAPATRERLFKAFQKGDKRDGRGRGWGLGLSIVKRIAEMLRAEVGYTPVETGGASFHFQLLIEPSDRREDVPGPPRWDMSLPLVAALTNPALHPGTEGRLNCLIAEDNVENAQLLGEILERHGCATVFARDGQEAIERAEEHRFDIIFMDIRMPRLDGVAASRWIRDHGGPNRDAPIVAVTANSNRTSSVDYRRAGMSSCITKPYTSADILTTLRGLTR